MTKHPLFRFFGSLKLAVVLLISLSGVLAVATGIESVYGTRAVKQAVYGTPWFFGILFLLATSLATAALTRFPWKRHQTGFVLTHLGIIVLLIGSALTSRFGIDGNLPVRQGNVNNQVILNGLTLSVKEEDRDPYVIPLAEYARKREGVIKTIEFPGASLEMDQFLPRTWVSREFKPSPLPGVGSPALFVELSNDRFSVREWLFQRNLGSPAVLSLGPATLSLDVLNSPEQQKRFQATQSEAAADPGTLVIQKEGREYRARVKNAQNRWVRLGGGLELFVEKYFPYAVVVNNQLVSKSNEPVNPAVTLRVRDPQGAEEKHTIFALYPEFATLHRSRSVAQPPLGLAIRLFTEGRQPASKGELRFAQSADGNKLHYRIVTASNQRTSSGKVILGKAFSTGWMDLQFKVTQWFAHAVEEQTPRYVDKIAGSDAPYLAAAHFNFKAKDGKESFWLFEGMDRVLPFGERIVSVGMQRELMKLPFQVELEKFTVHKDPGTDKAAGFESQVRIQGDQKLGLTKISMNEPLQHGGYTFYQASYQMEEGSPPVSIFSVNYDPGRWVKYAGSLFFTLGIILMFYMNPHYWNILLGQKKERP